MDHAAETNPSLIVFDLDLTLWNCGGLWIDCTQWPFHQDAEGRIFDSSDAEFHLYPDILDLLDEIEDQNIALGIASRTSAPSWAEWVLKKWDLWSRFEIREIYPGSKVDHFQQIATSSGLPFSEMLFFDDEERNITEVSQLGVCSILATRGVDRETYQQGITRFSDQHLG